MSYHNNMYDTVSALQNLGTVTFLTTRPITGPNYIIPKVKMLAIETHRFPKLHLNIFSLSFLLEHIPAKTEILIVKHLFLPRNILPIIIALLRGSKVICMAQSPTETFEKAVEVLTFGKVKTFSVTQTHALPYIPACIDPARVPQAQPSQGSASTLKIITVAKYQKRKNLDVLIDSIHHLKKTYTNTNLQLTIVGNILDSKIYSELSRKVDVLDLKKEVTLNKQMSHENTIKLLGSSDLFILPASKEPLGYSVVEAMAAGLPVIVTEEVGAKSYVQKSDNELIIKPRSVKALTQAIISFVNPDNTVNHKRLGTCGKNNRRIIESSHTPAMFREKFTKLIKKP